MTPRRRRAAAGLAALLLAAGAGVFAASEVRLRRVYAISPPPLPLPADAAALARGGRLARGIGSCSVCHGEDLGGRALGESPWLGRLHAPNLTPGRGGIAEHSTADLVRAIRHGVGRDGRPLVMMPAQYLRRLDDAALAAIVAYLRSLPATDRELPPRRVGPLARLLLAFGGLPDVLPAESIDHDEPPPEPPEAAATARYGAYLVETTGCKVCHHANLGGGAHPLALPGEPLPSDLTPSGPLAAWSEADFVRALRSGATPDGRQLDARFMPWPALGRMSDLELRAIWRHLRALPGRETLVDGSPRGATLRNALPGWRNG